MADASTWPPAPLDAPGRRGPARHVQGRLSQGRRPTSAGSPRWKPGWPACWDRLLADRRSDVDDLSRPRSSEIDAAQAEILLDTPLLAFDKLLVVKGHAGFAANWDGPEPPGQRDRRPLAGPARRQADHDLHAARSATWTCTGTAERLLFSDGSVLWEINADGTRPAARLGRRPAGHATTTPATCPTARSSASRTPASRPCPARAAATWATCTSWTPTARNERRVTFDQDHDWNPVVMQRRPRALHAAGNTPTCRTTSRRMLFRMNPDGTGQMEYYGSNSYWPNAMYWPRPIPGHPTMVVVRRLGAPRRVARRASWCCSTRPGAATRPTASCSAFPATARRSSRSSATTWWATRGRKFAAPYPLAEPDTNRGAGKYFLACVQARRLVDLGPVPGRHVRQHHADPHGRLHDAHPAAAAAACRRSSRRTSTRSRRTALIYLADVYQGDGLRGYPRGSIKALRVGTHHYRYAGNGDTRASSLRRRLGREADPRHRAGPRRRLGPVPRAGQHADLRPAAGRRGQGPAADAELVHGHAGRDGLVRRLPRAAEQRPAGQAHAGRARAGPSTSRPGTARRAASASTARCSRCSTAAASAATTASRCQVGDQHGRRRSTCGPSGCDADFDGRLQPGLHGAAEVRAPGRATSRTTTCTRRPSSRPTPACWCRCSRRGTTTCELDRDEWERLYTWIDFNVPYPANWRESHRPPQDEQVERRAKYKKLFADIDDRDEDPLPLPPIAAFEPPQPAPAPAAAAEARPAGR